MSNKLELSQKDKNSIERMDKRSPIMKFLRNQDAMRFQIGDVLVRQKLSWSSEVDKRCWETEMVSSVSNAPKKFVYVHENEFGIGYVKRLKADGKGYAEGCIICMTDVDPTYLRYIIDPDFADHMLLDGDKSNFEYDATFKDDTNKRQSILKENKRLLEDTKTSEAIKEWAKTLKAGDQIWIGRDIYQAVENSYTIKDIKFGFTSTHVVLTLESSDLYSFKKPVPMKISTVDSS